jgi:flagellar hook-length control protein FliK
VTLGSLRAAAPRRAASFRSSFSSSPVLLHSALACDCVPASDTLDLLAAMTSADAPPSAPAAAASSSSEAPPPPAGVSSAAAIAAEAAAALALVASHLCASELPKLALAARAVELGAAAEAREGQGEQEQGADVRVLALVSNVESGREESA